MAETRFAALKELRRDPPAPAAVPDVKAEPPAPRAARPPARATGKSSNPGFERLTVYVRKETKKAATRKWEDATGQDMSDLVEHLLSKYLNT